ncbi:MAG: GNAT family N-acetyltransferase [Chloroflexi bacterium]|nr:GNAT family N-acetyltransferase [Chloroflexota bacterium]
MIIHRELSRAEVERVWSIDRSEVIDHIYYFENGGLVLKPEHYDMHGWPPGEAEKYTPELLECFDRGGWFCGLFDDAKLIGVAVLDVKFIGRNKDQLQLAFLHVSSAYRNQGLGQQLFEMARDKAREKGAKRLYISATPSEHTIDFYRRQGCIVTPEPDPALFALEPEDIHLECDI